MAIFCEKLSSATLTAVLKFYEDSLRIRWDIRKNVKPIFFSRCIFEVTSVAKRVDEFLTAVFSRENNFSYLKIDFKPTGGIDFDQNLTILPI